ncbi:hect e3 ubiquitin [Pelomyxa schiedti]|nr:hect e3 ubiquitin [Pelomyxa schiedti]
MMLVVATIGAVSVIMITALAIGFAVSDVVLKQEINDIGTVQETIPSSYGVPFYAITPVKDQGHRGTCWAFATIGLLEAQYRAYGYLAGLLDDDEYVSFSEQAYALGVTEYCTQHLDDPYCFGGPPTNDTSDGEIEWLYYMRNYENVAKVIPYTLCPYYIDEVDQYNCPNREENVANTALSFTVNSIESAYTISGMKSLLYKYKLPVGWSHAVFERFFLLNDGGSYLYATSQCIECSHPCTTSGDGCCAQLIIPGYTTEGNVGWNDEYRVDRGLFGQLNQFTTGGFILKNSWNAALGHTIEYWLQGHSILEEDLICPCTKSSLKWLPANATCMMQNPDPIYCSNGAEKHARNVTLKGATVLKCSDNALTSLGAQYGFSNCNASRLYTLALVPYVPELKYQPSGVWTEVPAVSDGTLHFYLVEWDPLTLSTSIVKTNATTWWGIEKLFIPVEYVENDPRCTIRYPVGGHDTPSVSAIKVTWSKSSYLAGSRTAGKDYDSVSDSTYSSKQIIFHGPFDFDWATHNQ